MGIIQEINLIDGLENFVGSTGTMSSRKPPKLISFMVNGRTLTNAGELTSQTRAIFKIPFDDYALVNIKYITYNTNTFSNIITFPTVMGEVSFTKGDLAYIQTYQDYQILIPSNANQGIISVFSIPPAIDTLTTEGETIFICQKFKEGTYLKCLVELI